MIYFDYSDINIGKRYYEEIKYDNTGDIFKNISKYTSYDDIISRQIITFIINDILNTEFGDSANVSAALNTILQNNNYYKSIEKMYLPKYKDIYLNMLNFYCGKAMIRDIAYSWDKAFCEFIYDLLKDYKGDMRLLMYGFEKIDNISKMMICIERFKPDIYKLFKNVF